MLTAINAGLERQLFGLNADDNRWTGTAAYCRFDVGGLPALASVGDAGFGELVFKVAINPKKNAERLIEPFTGISRDLRFEAGDGYASGWLERRKGKWLQSSSGPICTFRRSILPAVGGLKVPANGYAEEGPLMM